MIENHLQAAFPEAVIYIGKKLTNEEWVALGSPLPFVIIGETEDVVALHSYSDNHLLLVDKATGLVKVGNGTVELGKFFLINQYGFHCLYSHIEFDEKVEVKIKEPPTVVSDNAFDKVVIRARRKKVVVNNSCQETLALLFPDFEIEVDSDTNSFIKVDCSLYDLGEHLTEMGCYLSDNEDLYLYTTEKEHFFVNYKVVEGVTEYKVWLSIK